MFKKLKQLGALTILLNITLVPVFFIALGSILYFTSLGISFIDLTYFESILTVVATFAVGTSFNLSLQK